MCLGCGLKISYERNYLKSFWKKRLLGVCLPFWMIDFIGLLITGEFIIEKYLLDFAFVKPATSYGWFMRYIVICYLIFYIVKRFVKDSRIQLLVNFGVWFVLESFFLASPVKARQMLSFPFGVLLGMKKNEIERTLTVTKCSLFLIGG